MSTIAKTRKPTTTRHREEDDEEERFSKSRMGPLVRRKRKKDQRKGTTKVYEDTDEDESSSSSSEAYPSPSSSSHEDDSDSDGSSSGEEEIVAARNKAGKPSLKKKVTPVKAPAKAPAKASRSTNEVAPRGKSASSDRNKKAKRFHHKVNEEEEEEEIHGDRKGNVKPVQRDRKMARKATAPSHHLKEVELDDDDGSGSTAIIREKRPRGRPRKSSSVRGSAAASPSLERSGAKKTRRGVIKGGIRKKRRTLVRTRRAASMGLPHGQVMFFVNGKKAPLFMRVKKNQTTTMTGDKEGMEISNNNELDEDFSRLVLSEASSAGSGRLNNRNLIQKHQQQRKGDGSVEIKGEWGEGENEEEEEAVNASRGNVKSASAVINSVKRGKKRDHVKTCLPFGPYTRMIKAILSEFNSSSTVLDDTLYPNDPATPLPQMRITKKAIKLMQAIDEADFVEDLSNSERILRCLDKSTLTPRIIKVAVVTSCKGNNFNQFNLPSTNFIPALPPRPKKTQQQHRIRPSSVGGLPSQSEEQMAF